MMNNPFKDRDLHTLLLFPKISWSSYSSFTDYDKDEWYNRYVLGIRSEPNSAMAFGVYVGERLVSDPLFLPEVPRPEIYELELKSKIGDIEIIGHLDGWSPETKELLEYKTTCNPNRWTQEKVDAWDQVTMYCLLLWQNYKIRPEDVTIRLTAIMGQEEEDSFEIHLTNEIKVFSTKRTMKDMLVFGSEIKHVHKEMQKFINNKQKDETN